MKRLFGFLLLILLLLAGIFYVTVYTTTVSKWLIKQLVAQNLPDYKIQSLTIKSQDFHFPRELKCNDLKTVLKSKNDRYDLSAEHVTLDWLHDLVLAHNGIALTVEGFNLNSSNIKLHSLGLKTAIRFGQGTIQAIDGTMKSADVDLYSFKMTDLTTRLEGAAAVLKFKDFLARGYDGQIKGEITVHYQPDVTFAVDIKLAGLDLKQLEKFNQSIFSNLEGKLYGNIRIEGDPKNLSSLEVDAKVVEEGKVRASVLKFFTQYLPNTQQKAEFDSLVKTNGKLPFEKATFQLKNLDQHNLSGLLAMSSKTINLDLNVPLDIKIDGKWDSLIRWWQELPKK